MRKRPRKKYTLFELNFVKKNAPNVYEELIKLQKFAQNVEKILYKPFKEKVFYGRKNK